MLWIMALHVISMVVWFSGIFYLPRLFVYHAMAKDETSIARFKVMERKLYRGITTPGGILTTVFGIWLVNLNPSYYFQSGWFHVKLTMIVLLWIYHLYCGYLCKVFKADANKRSHVFYRYFNEIPVLFLVVIVIMVVVKPF